jgi:hypothetical protein
MEELVLITFKNILLRRIFGTTGMDQRRGWRSIDGFLNRLFTVRKIVGK